MKIGVEQKKIEAIARMNQLRLPPPIIQRFEENGCISISKPPRGTLCKIDGEDLARIRKFEMDYDALVYVVVRASSTKRQYVL